MQITKQNAKNRIQTIKFFEHTHFLPHVANLRQVEDTFLSFPPFFWVIRSWNLDPALNLEYGLTISNRYFLWFQQKYIPDEYFCIIKPYFEAILQPRLQDEMSTSPQVSEEIPNAENFVKTTSSEAPTDPLPVSS